MSTAADEELKRKHVRLLLTAWLSREMRGVAATATNGRGQKRPR